MIFEANYSAVEFWRDFPPLVTRRMELAGRCLLFILPEVPDDGFATLDWDVDFFCFVTVIFEGCYL